MGKAVDDRSDIYSLGILLYEMLRGEVPFKAETLVGVAMKHVNDPMPDIQSSRPGTSSALAAVIERATQKDPKKRYSDMGAMLADLEGALEVEIARAGGATGEATTVLETVPSRSRILSSRSVSIVGILLVLAACWWRLRWSSSAASRTSRTRRSPARKPRRRRAATEIELSNPVDFDPVGWRRRASRGGGSRDRRRPRDVLAHFDLQRRADPRGGGQAGRGADRRDGRARHGARHRDPDRESGLDRRDLRHRGRAADRPVEGWGEPLSAQPFVANEEETTIPLNEKEADHFLIWITELTENRTTSGYFATIGEVSLFN